MLQTVRGDEALVISQLAQDWGLRERQSDRPVATPHRRTKIFSVFTRDCRDSLPTEVSNPFRPARIPVKKETERADESSKFRGGAFCPRDVLHLLSFCQRSSFLLRPSSSLLSFSIPSSSHYQNCRREDGGKRIIPILLPPPHFLSLTLSLPLRLSRSSRSTSEPAIRSLGLSRLLAR